MRITLDHNVIIDMANRRPNVESLRQALSNAAYEACVVEIGASEMRQRGIRPDRYDLFEELLCEAGLESAPRLAPMMIWDVTFWDHGLWCDDEMERLSKQIEAILFGESTPIDVANLADDSPEAMAWLNRLCDIQSMWCHLHNKNDVFVTSDRNFHKATKRPRLLELGARQIARPDEL
jgi:hypothetical protein